MAEGVHEIIALALNVGRVEVDYFDGEDIFVEVFDMSTFDGKTKNACVTLTAKQAKRMAKHLRKAAKAAKAND